MIAERDHVGAGTQQPIGDLRRDSCAVRDVLAVDDADVRGVLLAQARQTLLDRVSPRDAEDVREKENLQFRTSVAAGRSSTETWFPESFV